jgi:hypothetical protein
MSKKDESGSLNEDENGENIGNGEDEENIGIVEVGESTEENQNVMIDIDDV